MHIVIATAGSRGDVQPYIALALRARAAGHRVTIATHAVFGDWIRGFGIDVRTLHGDPRSILDLPGARAWLADGSRRGMLAFVRDLRRAWVPLLEGQLRDLTTVTADADVVVYGVAALGAAQLHEASGVPVIAGFPMPLTPTAEFPPAGLTYRDALTDADRRRNRIAHAVGQQLLWQPARRTVNRWRTDVLHIPALPFSGPFARQRSPTYPICHAFSPAVIPAPADWPAWVAPTGWWFLDAPGYVPPPALQSFIDVGDAPVTIGFGSMTPQDGAWLTGIIARACERAECRVVLLQGWGEMGDAAPPSWMHVERDVPHAWLYARSGAIVHHGGSGTTGAAVRSGVPSQVIPLGFDQQFWGSRLHTLGVAPPAIRRRDLTVDKLVTALRTMRTDQRMRESAAALGERVRAEDGTGIALARIEAHARRG